MVYIVYSIFMCVKITRCLYVQSKTKRVVCKQLLGLTHIRMSKTRIYVINFLYHS